MTSSICCCRSCCCFCRSFKSLCLLSTSTVSLRLVSPCSESCSCSQLAAGQAVLVLVRDMFLILLRFSSCCMAICSRVFLSSCRAASHWTCCIFSASISFLSFIVSTCCCSLVLLAFCSASTYCSCSGVCSSCTWLMVTDEAFSNSPMVVLTFPCTTWSRSPER